MSSEEMAKEIKAKLDPLVKAGTITQDQEDKIISFKKAKYEERKSEMDKVKNMTDVEKKAYFENKKKNRPGMLKELVESKVINKEQADAVREAIGKKGFKGEKKFDKINKMKSTLDSAVKDGTITKSQEDKILAYINQVKESRKAEMEKVKAMTEEERKSYFESRGKAERKDMFVELVKAGTITQAQADKLKAMMPVCKKGPGFEKHDDKRSDD
jgi:hypothetical protein